MTRPMFYLIDGHAVAYRQYFGLKGTFSTKSGEQTNAVFGFTRALLDILQKDQPQYLAVTFDAGLSGREALFEPYKGTRAKMPTDLEAQLARIEQVVRAFNIPVLMVEGYEADDVIGTVASMTEQGQEPFDLHVVTGDGDLLQLLNGHVRVQLPTFKGGDVVWDEAMFREKYHFEPRFLPDYKGLVGDTSDNIPGVSGIGDGTATPLIQQYGTLENIYANLDEIKPQVRKKLEEGRDTAFLSRELATIKRNVPIELRLPDCVAHDYDVNTVAELFRELEFRQFSQRLYKGGTKNEEEPSSLSVAEGGFSDDFAAPPEVEGPEAVIVRDQAALDDLVETLNRATGIAFDVETTSLDHMASGLVGISLAVDGKRGYYIPVGHVHTGDLFGTGLAPGQLPLQTVLAALREPLTNPNIPKYAHNASFDLVVLQRYGIDVSPITFDTMIAEWVRDPVSKFTGLKAFAFQYLGIHMTEISELIGSGKKQITMDRVDIERAGAYAAADAAVTYRAVDYLRSELEKEPALLDLFNRLDMPFVPVIVAMERAGVTLDTDYLAQLSEYLTKELQRIEQEVYNQSEGYGPFNINSPKQLNDVLFGKLHLSVEGVRKTQHGYTTDAATLENLSGKHPIIEHILEYREVSKLKSTYVDALPALINPHTGRVHTNYNQTGTSTGRMSSNNPNLQNIPIRTELGRQVRKAFIAPPGKVLLSVDYSQIELRILAHLSEDPTLLQAFAQGQDIHAATAAAVYGIPIDQVTKEQRTFAKRVNFGIIYGMGAFRLARDSNLSVGQARDFIETYFGRLPLVKRYLDSTREQARRGPLFTLFGRRREFPILQHPERYNQNQIQGEERVAINMPIQGSAADIIKKAMIDLHHELRARRLQSQMILQVHDELVFEVPEDEITTARDLAVSIMENAYTLKAPLRVNAQVGPNWRDMVPAE